MARLSKELLEVLAVATVIFSFNVWEHLPIMEPHHYSDVVGVFYREGIGTGSPPHLLPYYHYIFEYPVVVGLLVYISSYTVLFTEDFFTALHYYTLIMDAFLYVFTIGTVAILYRLCGLFSIDRQRIMKFFMIMPTFWMFTVYNWDMIAVFFTLLSLYLFLTDRRLGSAFSLGLGISTKLYPGILLPLYLLEIKSWKQRSKYFIATFAPFLALNLPFMIFNFENWYGTWEWHANWPIEDSWLIYFFDSMDPRARYVSIGLMLTMICLTLYSLRKKVYQSRSQRIIGGCMLMSISWLFGNYVVPPQMALLILPFYVLVPSTPLLPALMADIFNGLIIALWFTSRLYWIEPILPQSPVQAFATLRQLLWLSFFVYSLSQVQIDRILCAARRRLPRWMHRRSSI